ARQEEIDAPTVLHVATTDAACDNGAKSRVAQHPKYYLVLWSHHLLNQDALKAAFPVRPKGRSQLVVRRVNAGLVADVQAHTSCLPAVRHHRGLKLQCDREANGARRDASLLRGGGKDLGRRLDAVVRKQATCAPLGSYSARAVLRKVGKFLQAGWVDARCEGSACLRMRHPRRSRRVRRVLEDGQPLAAQASAPCGGETTCGPYHNRRSSCRPRSPDDGRYRLFRLLAGDHGQCENDRIECRVLQYRLQAGEEYLSPLPCAKIQRIGDSSRRRQDRVELIGRFIGKRRQREACSLKCVRNNDGRAPRGSHYADRAPRRLRE